MITSYFEIVLGLMESLGQQFSGRNNRLTFMTVAPKAEPRYDVFLSD